jgi:uroporphyrinogen decarboxylase
MAPVMPEGMKIIGQTGGIFERAQELCGYVGLCMMLRTDRELVRAIFDRLSELYVTMYRGMAQIDAVGALVISDDLGFKTQTLVAPEDLREFAFPEHKRLVQLAHEAGKPCIMHSCGNLAEIMDDLIDDVGIDAKHSYEDVILPVAEAKRLYGERLTILGGFDLDQLCRGSEEEIRQTTRRLLAECGATGGYALGSGNSIAHYVPAQNYLTLLDEGWKMRKLS